MQGSTYATSLGEPSFQYIAGCGLGGGNRPVPDTATDAWRVSGSVQSISGDEAIIQLDWRRIRADGVAVNSPGASLQLTLHPGDRVPLDSVNRDATAQCAGRTIGFEARYGPRPFTLVGGGSSQVRALAGTSVQSGSGGGIGRGSGGGGGGGGAVRTEVGSTSNAQEMSQTDVTSRAVHVPKTDSADTREFSADLWLVKTDPGRPEPDFNLQGLILQKVHGTSEFAFTPFTMTLQPAPSACRYRAGCG